MRPFNGGVPILNKDMTLCISLSARPSNNGTRFHNYLYDQLGLNWIYKAFAPTDLAQAIAGVRGLGIRGCAVSMPYKEDVIALVDVMDPSAKAIDSVNTIVNDGGRLTAYNTDYTAIEQLLERNAVPSRLLGAAQGRRRHGQGHRGGPARRRLQGRHHHRPERGLRPRARGPLRIPVARRARRRTGRHGGHDHQRDPGRHGRRARTPTRCPSPPEAIDAAKVVFDVVALPPETPLIKAAGRPARRSSPARKWPPSRRWSSLCCTPASAPPTSRCGTPRSSCARSSSQRGKPCACSGSPAGPAPPRWPPGPRRSW